MNYRQTISRQLQHLLLFFCNYSINHDTMIEENQLRFRKRQLQAKDHTQIHNGSSIWRKEVQYRRVSSRGAKIKQFHAELTLYYVILFSWACGWGVCSLLLLLRFHHHLLNFSYLFKFNSLIQITG